MEDILRAQIKELKRLCEIKDEVIEQLRYAQAPTVVPYQYSPYTYTEPLIYRDSTGEPATPPPFIVTCGPEDYLDPQLALTTTNKALEGAIG